MDELDDRARPDVGVKVEHVSTGFLVKKGKHNLWLGTVFNTIYTYAKPSPSSTATTNDVFCFQLPMQESSLKYLGFIIPFRGLPHA